MSNRKMQHRGPSVGGTRSFWPILTVVIGYGAFDQFIRADKTFDVSIGLTLAAFVGLACVSVHQIWRR